MGEIRIFGLGVLVFMSYLAFIQCDETTKSKENSVLVHFMDQKRSEFLPIVPTIKEAIANAFNEYCRNESANCENFKNIKITPKNVKFFGSNDREKFHEETRFVISNIYIDNEDSDQEADILSKQIASDFFKNSRDEIVKNSKVQIAYIDNQLVFPARDNLDNWLIVSISCAFCVALIILNLVCQMRISKAEKKKFLNEAKELKPLVKKANVEESEKKVRNPSIHSEASDSKLSKPNVLSRHDSFDQKLDVKTKGGKRRKKNKSMVAGSVGSGIGSPRNLTDNLDDDNRWDNQTGHRNTDYPDPEYRRSKTNSNYSINRNGDVQIPITYDRRNYPDSRVAYRLASNEKL